MFREYRQSVNLGVLVGVVSAIVLLLAAFAVNEVLRSALGAWVVGTTLVAAYSLASVQYASQTVRAILLGER